MFTIHELSNLVVDHIWCWTLVYRLGEFINPHTDAAGDIQVLVCLQPPSAQAHGGQLILRPDTPQHVTLALGAGDALAFPGHIRAPRHDTSHQKPGRSTARSDRRRRTLLHHVG
jgi:hypothetical protein